MDKINFTIDGRPAQAGPGQTILEAAEAIGVKIPTLCRVGRISKTTSCFVCVVKDSKTGRFMPSCSACPSEGMTIESDSEEVRDMRRTALNLLLSEHSGDCEAPCTIACPAHAKVEEYVRAGREGKFLDALKIIKERIPLPMSIGRVCPRFCEKDCRKNVVGEPVAINEFKRLAADLHYDDYLEELPEPTGAKVAIIGAGPAGLGAAYFLRLQGVESVVFEQHDEPGGMLRYGIPEFRLPKEILAREIEHFRRMGVDIRCGRKIGGDFTVEKLEQDYDAVVAAIGCWKPSPMRVEGEELAEQGIDWLCKVAVNDYEYENPGVTVVIGGGSTAMDCCRTPLRLGAPSVTCVYRRTEKEMPAERLEVEEAIEEGVEFQFLTAPVKLARRDDGKLLLTCQKMALGEPDASGRRRPVPIENSEFDITADTVIAAIGQKTDAAAGLETNRWGDVDVDEDTGRMGGGKIFAAGDCATGAATVVEAVAGARKAANAIADMLAGRECRGTPVINVSRGHWRSLMKDDLVFLSDKVSEQSRVKPEFIDMERRKNSFDELFPTFTAEQLHREGQRCIECGCTAKSDCKLKAHSEEYGAKPDAIGGEKVMNGYDNRHPSIIHDRGKCVKCGVCVKICAEIVNKSLLSQKNRGFATKVETAFGRVLPDSCSECGACVEECPVGALDWKNKTLG